MPEVTNAKIKVHAIFTDPNYVNVPAVEQMLSDTTSIYIAKYPITLGVSFELASYENVFEQALIDEGPTGGVGCNFHLARQARAVRYPGKLVVYFRPGDNAQSSTWADYVVMQWADSSSFPHEVGHFLHLGHTFNEGITNALNKANESGGHGAAKSLAIKWIEDEGLEVFDGDAGDPDTPEGGGFASVGDTPPDPGPPLFQTTYYVPGGSGAVNTAGIPNEHCGGTGRISLLVKGKPVEFAPDRTNVMSYFFGCPNTVPTVSPHQRQVIRRVLVGGNRRHLLNGASHEGPASVVTPDGFIHVFARGDDRNIYRNVWNGTVWSGWLSDMGAATFLSGPAAVVTKDGTIHVFACADDQTIWHSFWNGQGWSGWRGSDLPGGTFTSAPTAVVTPDGFIHVFARGGDRNIWRNVGKAVAFKGIVWNGWLSDMGAGTFVSGPTAVATTGGNIHVFALGFDRNIWHSFWNGKVWSGWRGKDLPGGTLTSAPTAVVTPADGFIHVFGRGDKRNIWHNVWNGNTWIGWKPDLTFGTFMSGVATAVSKDQALHAFAMGDDRSIFHSVLNGKTWSGWGSDLPGGTFQP